MSTGHPEALDELVAEDRAAFLAWFEAQDRIHITPFDDSNINHVDWPANIADWRATQKN